MPEDYPNMLVNTGLHTIAILYDLNKGATITRYSAFFLTVKVLSKIIGLYIPAHFSKVFGETKEWAAMSVANY